MPCSRKYVRDRRWLKRRPAAPFSTAIAARQTRSPAHSRPDPAVKKEHQVRPAQRKKKGPGTGRVAGCNAISARLTPSRRLGAVSVASLPAPVPLTRPWPPRQARSHRPKTQLRSPGALSSHSSLGHRLRGHRRLVFYCTARQYRQRHPSQQGILAGRLPALQKDPCRCGPGQG